MYDEQTRRLLAVELTRAMLSTGPWTAEQVAERGAGCLDHWPSWMAPLGLRIVAVHRSPPTDRPAALIALIDEFLRDHQVAEPERETAPPAQRHPAPSWPVTEIDSVQALAARLELSGGQLAWLADVRAYERTASHERLRNYRYRALARPGGVPRVIEAPKARLKEIQRWVLREILTPIPPHNAAHGFTPDRSVITHARLHTHQPVVLRLDLKDFFASVEARRVFGIFRTAGYAKPVAVTLTGLCTNTVPLAVWSQIERPGSVQQINAHFWLGRQLATPHLPQGAPTSPALANLAAYGLDRRLTGLAASLGLRYSRYADDLTFSGPPRLPNRARPLIEVVARIASDEGFRLNRDKSDLRTDAGRQVVCGVVVNSHPNIPRAEYDRLKAILHNLSRNRPMDRGGVPAADLEAHLRGRVAWVASLNPSRGRRLESQLEAIDWNALQ